MRPIALCAAHFASVASTAASAQPQPAPVVLELFQSQGCSSCPPANANVNGLVDRPDVLALSFGVTYWDNLGWKDTFARREFTARQYDYAHGQLGSTVATPEVVINGRLDLIGNNRRALEDAVRAAGPPQGARVIVSGAQAAIAAAPRATTADVWLVRYDPRVRAVAIRAGENSGRTLPHRNVVVELVRLGGWTGKAQTYPLPPANDPLLRTAVLVQDRNGGPILGAARH